LREGLSGKGLMRNRAGILIAFGFLLCLFIFSFRADAAKYYRYKDSKGRLHIVDSLDKIPENYRDQVEAIDLERGKIKTVPERWFVFGMSLQEVKDINFPGLMLYAGHTSRAIYWLSGELIALVIFLICLFVARDFPTVAERRRFRLGTIILYLIWLILSVPFGLRPAAIEFCRASRGHLALVREDSRVPVSSRDRARSLDRILLSVQQKIP
jgi:hypothetical protein